MSAPKKTLGGSSAKKAPPGRAKGDSVKKIPANQGKSSVKKAKGGGDSSKKHSPTMHGETAVALNEMEVGQIRDEHEKTLSEERRQKCWLCLVVVACVLAAMVLLGVVLVDRYVIKPSKGPQMTGGVPIFSNDNNDSSSADKAEVDRQKEEAVRAKIRKMLVNLTESCMALEPQGCFYHKNRYPDNCKKTKCNSIIVNLISHKSARLFTWSYTNETKEIPVLDKTPCARGKLCIGGECVDRTEETYYGQSDVNSGGVGMECDLARSCVRLQNKMLTGDIAKQFTTCAKRDCSNPVWPDEMFFNEIAVRFLSCNNPMPVEMDPLCFMKFNDVSNDFSRKPQADHIPFVMYELCQICNKATKPHPAACYPHSSVSEPVKQFGYPCVSGTKMNTYCAGDFSCVATYKDSPDSYEKRPVMTCDK